MWPRCILHEWACSRYNARSHNLETSGWGNVIVQKRYNNKYLPVSPLDRVIVEIFPMSLSDGDRFAMFVFESLDANRKVLWPRLKKIMRGGYSSENGSWYNAIGMPHNLAWHFGAKISPVICHLHLRFNEISLSLNWWS
mgnify:CR=1 FL=1